MAPTLALALVLAAAAAAAVSGQTVDTPTLSLAPATERRPAAVTVAFALTGFTLTTAHTVVVRLAGMTNGPATNQAGETAIDQALSEVQQMAVFSRNNLQVYDSSVWQAGYYEGSVERSFVDSFLLVSLKPGQADVAAGTRKEVTVDASALLKTNCGDVPSTWTNFAVFVVDFAGGGAAGSVFKVGDFETKVEVMPVALGLSTPVGGTGCYLTGTGLHFTPALPRVPTSLSVSFTVSMLLGEGDTVEVALPGFTSGAAAATAGSDLSGVAHTTTVSFFSKRLQRTLTRTGTAFTAAWVEGTYVQHETGFAGSKLVFTVGSGVRVTPGKTVSIAVPATVGLKAQCGFPANWAELKIGVTLGTAPAFNHALLTTFLDVPQLPTSANLMAEPLTPRTSGAPAAAFEKSSAVGDGCRSLNFCSGRGTCDACNNVCACEAGFGASTDVATGIKPDCSERVCPSGRALSGGLPSGAAPLEAHPVAECSNAGTCKRRGGTCSCFDGYAGGACERRVCPLGPNGRVCSGQGRCHPLQRLAKLADALPLTRTTSSVRYTDLGDVGGATWDAAAHHACVCDSISWNVGLGADEVNVPEFFGPDCALRHCPFGNDPQTGLINEMNASKRLAPAGKGRGYEGNFRFLECSGRGACDHHTGTCACFDGFANFNCGVRRRWGI